MRVDMPKTRKDNREHSSVVGGSTAKLVRLCNASMQEARKAPVEHWNRWSAEGTALHKVVEAGTLEELTDEEILREFTGVEIEGITLTEVMLKAKALPAVQYFFDTVPADATVAIEAKVSLEEHPKIKPHFHAIKGAFGTGDVLFYTPRRAGGIDYKFGDGHIVDAEDNDQARFYLVCGIQQGVLPIREEYEFHFFQPAASRKPDEYASVAYYTLADLVEFALDLRNAVESAPVYVTGPHCTWCKGKLTCKAYKDLLTTAVKTDIAGLSSHELAKLKEMLPGLAHFIKMVDAACLRNAQAGLEVPGWALEPAEGNRAWKDTKSALGALGRLGVPLDVRQIKAIMTAPQALAWLRGNGTPEEEVLKFERRHIVRPDNGERLVKAKPGAETGGALQRLAKGLAARGL